jgi:small-conductance mechanosensitive channel
LIALLGFAARLAGCTGAGLWDAVEREAGPAVRRSATVKPTPADDAVTSAGIQAAQSVESTPIVEGVIVTRTPEPTATPGLIESGVEAVITRAGLARTEFLGLTIPDWASLGRFALKVALGYLGATLLVRVILPLITRRTRTAWDDWLLERAGGHLRWLIVVLVLDVATGPLTFLSAEVKQVLGDGYFSLALIVAVLAAWGAIDLVAEWYYGRTIRGGRERELSPAITLLARLSRLLLMIFAGSALLAHFGVNVPALAAALGLGGLAISLAARDAIAGLLILLDRPFRVGDRIEVRQAGTWGEVVEIGLRTTRIRTWRNRAVIVSNSHIGWTPVVNYSYPDPGHLAVQQVNVAHGADVERARRTIVEAVRQVEGVLADRPVHARYVEMSEVAMVYRVEWVESIAAEREVVDRVTSALQGALDAAGIEMP